MTKSANAIKFGKFCHSICYGGLDVAELCYLAPVNVLKIKTFGQPVIFEGEGSDLFCRNPDVINDMEEIFDVLKK